MLTKLKRSELAKALGVSNAVITMAVKRNKLELTLDGFVDVETEKNKMFIEYQVMKGKSFDLTMLPLKQRVKTKTKERIDSHEHPLSTFVRDDSFKDLELKKKKLEIKRLERGNELDQLKIEKLKGQLVPFDAVKSVFLYSVETFRATYMQEVIGIANIFKQRLNASQKEFVEVQKDITERIDLIQKDIKDNLLKGLYGIVNEYKEVRGRGERK